MPGLKVLVCDDSEYIRLLITRILNDMGHEVIGEATDGREAVEKYITLRPDAVTIDVIMPIQHGIQSLTEIIEFDKDAKIVIVSAVTHEPLIKKGLALGALNFITKPFSTSEFIGGFRIVGE